MTLSPSVKNEDENISSVPVLEDCNADNAIPLLSPSGISMEGAATSSSEKLSETGKSEKLMDQNIDSTMNKPLNPNPIVSGTIENEGREVPVDDKAEEASSTSTLVGNWLSKRRERRREKRLAAQAAFEQQFHQMRLRLFLQGEEVLPPLNDRPFTIALPRKSQSMALPMTAGNETDSEIMPRCPELSTDFASRSRDSAIESLQTSATQAASSNDTSSVRQHKNQQTTIPSDPTELHTKRQSTLQEKAPIQQINDPFRSCTTEEKSEKEAGLQAKSRPSAEPERIDIVKIDERTLPRHDESSIRGFASPKLQLKEHCSTDLQIGINQERLAVSDRPGKRAEREASGSVEPSESQLDAKMHADGQAISNIQETPAKKEISKSDHAVENGSDSVTESRSGLKSTFASPECHKTHANDETSTQSVLVRSGTDQSTCLERPAKMSPSDGESSFDKEDVANSNLQRSPRNCFSEREEDLQPEPSDSPPSSPLLSSSTSPVSDVVEGDSNGSAPRLSTTPSDPHHQPDPIAQTFVLSHTLTYQTPSPTQKMDAGNKVSTFARPKSESPASHEKDEISFLQQQPQSNALTKSQVLDVASTPQPLNGLQHEDGKSVDSVDSHVSIESPKQRREECSMAPWQPITQQTSQSIFFYTQATQESQSSSLSQPTATALDKSQHEHDFFMNPSEKSAPLMLSESLGLSKSPKCKGNVLDRGTFHAYQGSEAITDQTMHPQNSPFASPAAQRSHGAMFQNAGSGRQLSVSAEALAKAEALLGSGDQSFSTDDSKSAPCFQSAGSGRQLSVSAEALAKAEVLLGSGDDDSKLVPLDSEIGCHELGPLLGPKEQQDFKLVSAKPSRVSMTPGSTRDGTNFHFAADKDERALNTPGKPARVSIQTPRTLHTPIVSSLSSLGNSSTFSTTNGSSRDDKDLYSLMRGPSVADALRSGLAKSSARKLDFQIDHSLDQAISNGDLANLEECKLYNVHQTVLEADSSNSSCLRFDPDNGHPYSFENKEPSTTNKDDLFGSPDDWRTVLSSKGYDSSKVSDKWIINHCRWIIWKLCSIERRFCSFLANTFVHVEKVGFHLCKRYEREIVNGERSPLRMVLNRDITSRKMMILCIAAIFPRRPESEDDAVAYSLELTDGWHSILARPDSFLSKKVHDGILCVGRKILISDSALLGGDDGVDPLDQHYKVTPEGDSPFLRIFANGTRLAHWRAKLGFVVCRQSRFVENESLNVSSLRNVVPGGGAIPQINLCILKRYPIKYLGACVAEDIPRVVLSEEEEMDRRIKLQKDQANFVERIGGEVEKECLKVSFFFLSQYILRRRQ